MANISEKSLSNRYVATHMLKNLQQNSPSLLGICAIYTLVSAVYPILGVYLPRLLIEQLEGGRSASFTLENPIIKNILIILLGYFIFASILGGLKNFLEHDSYAKFTYLRLEYLKELTHKVMTADFSHYEHADFIDRTSRANRANQSNDTGVEEVYRQSFLLPALIVSAVILIVILAFASPWLVALPLLTFPSLLIALNRSDRFSFSHREQSSHDFRRIYTYSNLSQDFNYGKDIRLFRLESILFDGFKKVIADAVALVKQIEKKKFNYQLLPLFVSGVSNFVTLSILLYLALNGHLSVAQFSLYLSAFVSLNLTLEKLATSLNRINAEGRYVKEMIEYLETNFNDNSGTGILISTEPLTIEFRDVSFHYPASDKYVLEHLNLKIDFGKTLALVGINGAGKSTIVKLMTGLHHPSSGVVLVNGQDTRELDSEALYKAFSVVFQNETPLAVTVAEHVAGSSTQINRPRVEAALQRSGLLEKIQAEEKGIDTMLLKIIDEEGLQLSGGEIQKLMLARALYKDAPMMILDEPTSALDALAESKIYQEFSELMKGKTGLFVSHRLASTSFCDSIVLLSGGGILESGTHDELMAAKGAYYEMFVTQGKYYQSEVAVDV